MAIQYPDVMNDLTAAQQRFQVGCVQYLAEFATDPTPAGGVAQLVVTLQNTVDTPARLVVRVSRPRLKGKLRRRSEELFVLQESAFRLQLDEGEVGQLIIPVGVSAEAPPGTYDFTVGGESVTHESAQRTRSERSENQAQEIKIEYPQGLGIAQFLSWGYETKRKAEQSVSLEVVVGESQESEGLSPRYTSAWTPEDWKWITPARQELNDRRLHIMSSLDARSLFVDFLRESKAVFQDVGIQLDLGEALFVAKMLTYTVRYFMGVPAWQDCLLVPILAYAHSEELSTVDLRPLVTGVGYPHVLELAVALAFSCIHESLGREPWQYAEQRGLRDHILQCQSTGAALLIEFLYLPLILGGLVVAHELVLKGENLQQSLDQVLRLPQVFGRHL